MVSAALRAVGNIVTGDDIQPQVHVSLTRARAFALMHALFHSFTDHRSRSYTDPSLNPDST